MVEFSIIVPVYQAQQYLARLVNSVLAQSFSDYELILVDDGSLDGSERLCDDFSEKYKQIKTIHKTNGGVASARNEGIRNAKGRYMIFLDADDYLDAGFLEDASDSLKKKPQDILVYGYYLEEDGTTEKFLPQLKGSYTLEMISEHFTDFTQGSIFNSVCNKVFCTDIIRSNRLEFPLQKIGEDGIFVCQYLQKIKSFYFSDQAYYHYCQNGESAVHKYCESRWSDEKKYLQEVQKCVEALAPAQLNQIMRMKYRNAILFELYNLLNSGESALVCAKKLKTHLQEMEGLIDWHFDSAEPMLKLQLMLLSRCRTLEIIVLMRLKKRIKRLGRRNEN